MIDFFATAPHYLDHLAPVWHALPPSERGTFGIGPMPTYGFTTEGLASRARGLGLEVTNGVPAGDAPLVVAAIGNLNTARKAGRTRIALMEHGAGQSYGGDATAAASGSYAGGTGRRASLFLHPNAHANGRDREAYPATPSAIVGCPKLDALPERSTRRNDRPTVAVSFHAEIMLCPETQSAWREYRRALETLSARAPYRLIGHGHPRIIGELARYYRSMRIEVVPDLVDVIRRADVYLIDNSSSMFEVASAGIPIVVLDASFYRPTVNHGLRFYEAASVGVRVRARSGYDTKLAKNLEAAIEEALADPPERCAARHAALDLVYAYRTGAAARAAEAIGTWAAAPVEAVA